ncbi:MAG: nucleotide sugar dehydrogenase [Caldilineaceae bacterium]|nr:nucleotide sugar dehydrogenase [Caldilineaceae bacterium]
MKLAVFGLGYVGCVTAACFARDGHHVIGVDVNRDKVQSLCRGESPIVEPGLAPLIKQVVADGRLTATCDAGQAFKEAEVVLICVGTPSKPDGSLETAHVERVCRDIGLLLREHADYLTIVVRSTLLPGTASKCLLPLLEATSGKKAGAAFGFSVNPEFLREGSAIQDFDNPPYSIIGQFDEASGAQVAQLYTNVAAPHHHLTLDAAAMIKYASNAFHALKVVFANEVGNLCQAYDIDSHAVMDVFVQDTKLNISPYYLKPGFAFGGSCLGKELRALLYAARRQNLRSPVLEAVLPSNQLQIEKALAILLQKGRHSVGLLGLSFKPNTDDLRESPAVELAERLIGKGFDLHIYDREVALSRLHGSNRNYIDQAIPHISSLMQPSIEAIMQRSETVVVAKKLSTQESATLFKLLRPDQSLIDLVRLNGRTLQEGESPYYGICW